MILSTWRWCISVETHDGPYALKPYRPYVKLVRKLRQDVNKGASLHIFRKFQTLSIEWVDFMHNAARVLKGEGD